MATQSEKAELERRKDYAQRYAALGWPILPIHGMKNGFCTCENPNCPPARHGKHPARKNPLEMATTDPVLLGSYWALLPFNLALRIPAELAVVDMDDVTAHEALRAFGRWPVTPTHTTPRGLRMLFRWPIAYAGPSPTVGGLDGLKLDVLGHNGQCVLPPSVGASGYRYSWREGEAPWEIPLAGLPAAFTRHLVAIADARQKARKKRSIFQPGDAQALAKQRARYASRSSNGLARGAYGLKRTLEEQGLPVAEIEAALATFNAEAGV